MKNQYFRALPSSRQTEPEINDIVTEVNCKSTGNKFTQKALGVNSRHLGQAEKKKKEIGFVFVVVHNVCESLM